MVGGAGGWDKMLGKHGATAAPGWAIQDIGAIRAQTGQTMSSSAVDFTGRTAASPAPRGGAEAGLSIVVPLYNEADGLAALHERIVEVARRLPSST